MINSFGGNVFEVGVMLNYFHPAFYVDITGVEQLKSKASRICVWLAGIMGAYLPLFIMRMIIMGINHFVPTMMPIASRIMLVWGILGITLFVVRGIGARIMPYLRGRRIKDA